MKKLIPSLLLIIVLCSHAVAQTGRIMAAESPIGGGMITRKSLYDRDFLTVLSIVYLSIRTDSCGWV